MRVTVLEGVAAQGAVGGSARRLGSNLDDTVLAQGVPTMAQQAAGRLGAPCTRSTPWVHAQEAVTNAWK